MASDFENWPLDKKIAFIDSDPSLKKKYTEALIFCLSRRFMVKRFGEAEEHAFAMSNLVNALSAEGIPNTPFGRMTLEFESCKSIEEVKLVAKANGGEITDEDVYNAREAAIEVMLEDEN